ncbi:MAG: PAS domain-containing protein [Alphaproteobacteria bacterium HGW-Alphaproteobacteria-3]|nr:MAG: PAS domain-containing protein [Alphaproteobacteria bacterium HGW-Alphaproteobacteria-3]
MDMGQNGFRDPRLEWLYGYWLEKKGDRRAASRCDLAPFEVKPLLPILNLIDVRHEPLGFRHRLVGTEIVERLGRDATGCWVGSALYGPAWTSIFDGLRAVTEEVRPYRRIAHLDWHVRQWLSMESLELPLIGEDGEVNMIVRAASYFTDPHSATRERCIATPLAA